MNSERKSITKIFIIMKFIFKNSLMKRHHIFPLTGITMIVGREEENGFDPYAMVVKNSRNGLYIPLEDRKKITREKEPQQRVTAGKVVDRVPVNLSTVFFEYGAVCSNQFLVGIFYSFGDLVSCKM